MSVVCRIALCGCLLLAMSQTHCVARTGQKSTEAANEACADQCSCCAGRPVKGIDKSHSPLQRSDQPCGGCPRCFHCGFPVCTIEASHVQIPRIGFSVCETARGGDRFLVKWGARPFGHLPSHWVPPKPTLAGLGKLLI